MTHRMLRILKVSVPTLVLCCSSIMFGQTTGAQLTGQITDSTGASIPGARISVQNVDTNLEQRGDSDGQGVYLINFLPPGPYRLTVERQGFDRQIQTGIILTVNQTATLNISLHQGTIQQTVNVAA